MLILKKKYAIKKGTYLVWIWLESRKTKDADGSSNLKNYKKKIPHFEHFWYQTRPPHDLDCPSANEFHGYN